MDDKVNALKKECNVQGGALLIYKVIMNVAVGIVSGIAAVIATVYAMLGDGSDSAIQGGDEAAGAYMEEMSESIANFVMDSMGWGYFLGIGVGLLILLLWKKPAFFSKTLLKRGKPMKAGSFFGILCLFLSVQLLIQIASTGVEFILNQFDLSLIEVMENSTVSSDSVSMLIYMCIAAPIAEEILFRGLVLRSLEPYGKGFAVLVSAILFGFFHGSPIQTPFAMLVGLILGYVALEYNVVWAMILHLINNLVIGDMLPRLLSSLLYEQANIAFWGVILLASVIAAVYAWVNRKQIPAIMQELDTEDWQWSAALKSPCMIILLTLSLIDMAAVAVVLILM